MSNFGVFSLHLFISPLVSDVLQSELLFNRNCFIYLFQSKISKLHRPINAKFCRVILTMLSFIIPVQNFGGPPQKNFRGQKRAKFGTISDDFKVRRHISLEWIKIFNIGEVHFVPGFFRVGWKKFGELKSTNHRDLVVKSYPFKSTFPEDHIFDPKWCCAPKFLHTLKNGIIFTIF